MTQMRVEFRNELQEVNQNLQTSLRDLQNEVLPKLMMVCFFVIFGIDLWRSY